MKWNANSFLLRLSSYRKIANSMVYIKLIGNFLIGVSLVLAAYINSAYLFVSVLGFTISMYSDYFNKHLKRKMTDLSEEYEFILDFTMTVIGTFFISFGLMIYVGSPLFLFGIVLFVFYLWKLIMSLLYKLVSNKTFKIEIINTFQLKTLLALMIITEYFIPWSIIYSAMLLITFFAVTNFIDLVRLFAFTRNKNTDKDIMTYDLKHKTTM